MPYGSFVLFTALGALVWVSILAFLGYFIGENQALFAKYYQETVIILLAIGALFVIRQIRKKKKQETEIINSKKQE